MNTYVTGSDDVDNPPDVKHELTFSFWIVCTNEYPAKGPDVTVPVNVVTINPWKRYNRKLNFKNYSLFNNALYSYIPSTISEAPLCVITEVVQSDQYVVPPVPLAGVYPEQLNGNGGVWKEVEPEGGHWPIII